MELQLNLMFTLYKYSSLGNTIGLVEEVSYSISFIKNLCETYGIDQLMTLSSPTKIWNKDASEAKACGNGTRCLVAHIFEKKFLQKKNRETIDNKEHKESKVDGKNFHHEDEDNYWKKKGFLQEKEATLFFEGPVGPLRGFFIPDKNEKHEKYFSLEKTMIFVQQGSVTLVNGPISFSSLWEKIKNFFPNNKEQQYLKNHIEEKFFFLEPGIKEKIKSLTFFLTSIGNPHIVIPLWEEMSEDCQYSIGAFMEDIGFFPEKANVSFLHLPTFFIKTWERGVGWTLGCGSALCCSAFVIRFLLDSSLCLENHPHFFSPRGQGTPEEPFMLQTPGGQALVYEHQGFFFHGAYVEKIFEKNIDINL